MKVKVSRIDVNLPMPMYQTKGSAGFDIYAREEVTIMPGELVRIPTNLIVDTPVGYFLMLSLRSSTPKKKPGLVVPHGVGVVDSDYNGPDDEVLMQVLNTGDIAVTIEKGERFAQGAFVKIDMATFIDTPRPVGMSRGGFGSTG
ncbi:MAG: dUTP diphosphatase [Patescibacteria group bacterium]